MWPVPHRYALARFNLRAFAHRRFVAAMIRARPSGLRRRFFLAAFAGAGVAAASVLALRAAAHRFLCAAAIRLRAACWYLEHTAPEHFAKNRIELTGADGSPLTGAVAVYLPQKDGGDGSPVVTVDTVKEIANGN